MFVNIKNKIRNILNDKFILNFFYKNVQIKNFDKILNSYMFNNARPKLLTDFEQKKIIVIAPHPDDEVIGPGGTLIKEILSGSSVTVIYVTGCNNQERNKEATLVAKFLQFSPVFLNAYEKNISIDDDLLSAFSNIINKIKPDKIYIPLLCDDHDDHKRVNQLLLEAYIQGYIEKKKVEVWCYQVYTALPSNYIVNITDVVDKKKQAIRLYESQSGNRNWAHWVSGLNAFNTRYLPGSPDERFAETFCALELHDYIDICNKYFNDNDGSVYSNEEYS